MSRKFTVYSSSTSFSLGWKQKTKQTRSCGPDLQYKNSLPILLPAPIYQCNTNCRLYHLSHLLSMVCSTTNIEPWMSNLLLYDQGQGQGQIFCYFFMVNTQRRLNIKRYFHSRPIFKTMNKISFPQQQYMLVNSNFVLKMGQK